MTSAWERSIHCSIFRCSTFYILDLEAKYIYIIFLAPAKEDIYDQTLDSTAKPISIRQFAEYVKTTKTTDYARLKEEFKVHNYFITLNEHYTKGCLSCLSSHIGGYILKTCWRHNASVIQHGCHGDLASMLEDRTTNQNYHFILLLSHGCAIMHQLQAMLDDKTKIFFLMRNHSYSYCHPIWLPSLELTQ